MSTRRIISGPGLSLTSALQRHTGPHSERRADEPKQGSKEVPQWGTKPPSTSYRACTNTHAHQAGVIERSLSHSHVTAASNLDETSELFGARVGREAECSGFLEQAAVELNRCGQVLTGFAIISPTLTHRKTLLHQPFRHTTPSAA
ncbi:hypothetical protein QAD02_002154 [Eretmocerus hayati]|uniref:Uncharacterized protein n=1 Tax=Eretmocerus hayati TaxID=131215 RepID=A0ACC2NIB0_9HYME|nr:hypothetical protein QAD02_002154 [Eretmocerus hayati]